MVMSVRDGIIARLLRTQMCFVRLRMTIGVRDGLAGRTTDRLEVFRYGVGTCHLRHASIWHMWYYFPNFFIKFVGYFVEYGAD